MTSHKNYNNTYYSSTNNNKNSVTASKNSNSNYNLYGQGQFSNDSIRIIKRNLVYVINLDPKIADKDILTKKEYFGQYGKITKILVNLNKAYNSNNPSSGLSYSAYINYSNNQEAALAILSVDSCMLSNKMIKAAFGTTKYCSYYIKKQTCPIKDCVYMHTVSDKNDIISKDSADFYVDQHKLAVKISEIGNDKVRDLLYKNRFEETVMPNPYTIYSKRSLSHLIRKCTEEKDQLQEIPIKQDENTNQKQNLRDILTSNKENDNEHQSKSKEKSNKDYSEEQEKKSERSKSNNTNNSNENESNMEYNKITDSPSNNLILLESELKEEKSYQEENLKFNKLINKRQDLFNLTRKQQQSRFISNERDNNEEINSNKSQEKVSSVDEKILQNYFLRYSFSSAFSSKEKIALEEEFYKSISNFITIHE